MRSRKLYVWTVVSMAAVVLGAFFLFCREDILERYYAWQLERAEGDDRWIVAEKLRSLDSPVAEEWYIERLSLEPEWERREEAARMLGEMGSVKAVLPLLKLTSPEVEGKRQQMAAVAGKCYFQWVTIDDLAPADDAEAVAKQRGRLADAEIRKRVAALASGRLTVDELAPADDTEPTDLQGLLRDVIRDRTGGAQFWKNKRIGLLDGGQLFLWAPLAVHDYKQRLLELLRFTRTVFESLGSDALPELERISKSTQEDATTRKRARIELRALLYDSERRRRGKVRQPGIPVPIAGPVQSGK